MTRRTACGTTTKRSAFAPRQAERAGGSLLARVDGLDAGPVDLGHVGRVEEHERQSAPEELVAGMPSMPRPGRPEAQDVDDEDAGQAAEDVHVDDGEAPDGGEDGALQAAHDGQRRSPRMRTKTSASRKSMTFRRRPRGSWARPWPTTSASKKASCTPRPGGQVDDDGADDAEHQQRADDGHDDSPASLLGVAEESRAAGAGEPPAQGGTSPVVRRHCQRSAPGGPPPGTARRVVPTGGRARRWRR